MWSLARGSSPSIPVSERNADGVPAFFGSAYDVALLKGDGCMGGEVPTNQAAIDDECVAQSREDVALAGLAAVAALAIGLHGLRLRRRTSATAGFQPARP